MDSGSSDPLQHFRFCDIFKIRVLHPFLVILVLMFVLQFCGQGVITFYTVQIFKVRMWIRIGSDENYCPGLLQYCRVLSIIAQDACSIVKYHPVLSRTLAVLSSIIQYYPGRLQYCRGKGLRSCHWSHLLPLSFAQVFMITMAVMTATIMLLICHKLSLKTIQL